MSRYVAIASLVLATTLAGAPVAAPATERPNKFTLTVKGGEVNLIDERQTIAGTERDFDAEASNFLALEFETRFRGENVAVGGEIMRYSNRFRRASVTSYENSMRTFAVLATGKYFFGDGHMLEPYIGGGVGIVHVHDYGGPIEGVSDGLAAKAVIGLQLRGDRFGGRLELFHHRARVDDDKGDEVDASVRGILLGATFFFGSRPPRN
jgi:opacity protein-like surface antigen